MSERVTPAGSVSSPRTIVVPTGATAPADLLDAFDAYERALVSGDGDALAEAFVRDADSVRVDAAGVLVGHDAITAFRGRRGGIGSRVVLERRIRLIGEDAALVVSVNAPVAGGRGVITQLWTRDADRWRIASAQVQATPAAVDPRVWREVGTPLVAATAEGPLSGETIAVKDLFAIAGRAIGAGNPGYLAEARVESETASAVARLLAAGASVTGIARTDEFAYSIAGRNVHYGTPPNVAVPGAIPGGSSSGPVAAVALGQASIGLSTDTAGSIRVPASYQGLWGLRTTHDAVPRDGLLPLAPSFDTVGWITRTPELLAAVARFGLDSSSPRTEGETSVDRLVVDPSLLDSVAEDVRSAFDALLVELESRGAIEAPERVDLGPLAEYYEAFRIVQAAEAWAADGDWVSAHPGALGPDVAARFAAAGRISTEEEALARGGVARARESIGSALAGRVLVLPSASSTAPALDADPAEIDVVRAGTLAMTCVAGIGGYPAVSAPLLSVDGKPLGLCLVGPRGSDLDLVALAAGLADALA